MEFKGFIKEVLPLKQGNGKNGAWKAQEYVIAQKYKTERGEYERSLCFEVFGDKVDQFAIVKGEELAVEVDFDASEYNGRWYNKVRAWKVTRPQAQAPLPPAPQAQVEAPAQGNQQSDDEKLPF